MQMTERFWRRVTLQCPFFPEGSFFFVCKVKGGGGVRPVPSDLSLERGRAVYGTLYLSKGVCESRLGFIGNN
jgi:hypothetical protein